MSIESVAQYIEEESEEKVMDVAEETKAEEGTEMKEDKTMVTVTVMVTDPEKGTGGEDAGGGGNSGGGSGALMSKKEEKYWFKVLLGMRISAFTLCLKAFAVLAADMQKVVVQRSVYSYYYLLVVEAFRWNDYNEFKYSLAVNVVGFVYSGLQICELVKYLITKKHTINPRIRGYYSVIMDQGLAYLLMSASSSAATTVHIYRSYWIGKGAHKFTDMASAAVALSFLAFLAFASASIVSGLILFRCSGRP